MFLGKSLFIHNPSLPDPIVLIGTGKLSEKLDEMLGGIPSKRGEVVILLVTSC